MTHINRFNDFGHSHIQNMSCIVLSR